MPVFSTAASTQGWIFADTAYMVPPSLAIMGEEKMAIARSKRRLAQREHRMLEIRRSHLLAKIPPEILLAYRALVKTSS